MTTGLVTVIAWNQARQACARLGRTRSRRPTALLDRCSATPSTGASTARSATRYAASSSGSPRRPRAPLVGRDRRHVDPRHGHVGEGLGRRGRGGVPRRGLVVPRTARAGRCSPRWHATRVLPGRGGHCLGAGRQRKGPPIPAIDGAGRATTFTGGGELEIYFRSGPDPALRTDPQLTSGDGLMKNDEPTLTQLHAIAPFDQCSSGRLHGHRLHTSTASACGPARSSLGRAPSPGVHRGRSPVRSPPAGTAPMWASITRALAIGGSALVDRRPHDATWTANDRPRRPRGERPGVSLGQPGRGATAAAEVDLGHRTSDVAAVPRPCFVVRDRSGQAWPWNPATK